MAEYGVASAIYFAMLETQACETAQRVTAMDNASTNAKDMVDRFKLVYNRARQVRCCFGTRAEARAWIPAAPCYTSPLP